MSITPALLRKIEPRAQQWVIDGIAPHLDRWMKHYSIDTPNEIHHFLAQLAHESDHFKTLTEYASGAAYEGRRDLGNIYKGDGRRFKGRGPIQITGRANYAFYGKRIGVDLVKNPELAATPEIGVRIACEYWTVNGLGKIADMDNGSNTEEILKRITKKINGGYNGLADRRNALHRIKALLPGYTLASVTQPRYRPAPVMPHELPEGPIAATAEEPWWKNVSIIGTAGTFVTSVGAAVNNPYALGAIVVCVLAAATVGFAFYRQWKRDRVQYPKVTPVPLPEGAI